MIAQLYMADLRWFGFVNIYTVSQKRVYHFYFCNNFGKCRPILIILSLLYSQIYC